ncbi:MAG: dTMP kinase, partial [Dehalococcoidales bacterium]
MFITFEGCEGCGKSNQSRALHKRLAEANIAAVLTQEPGGTPLGEGIARWLKWDGDPDISPLAELLLFNASRTELVGKVLRLALDDGKVVISDRYTDSTIAYQGYGRGLDLATVAAINDTATGGLKPDFTILLDVPPEEGLRRKKETQRDRFEQEDIGFHRRVRNGYLKLAAALRAAGIGVELYPDPKRIGQQLKYAARRGFRIAL